MEELPQEMQSILEAMQELGINPDSYLEEIEEDMGVNDAESDA